MSSIELGVFSVLKAVLGRSFFELFFFLTNEREENDVLYFSGTLDVYLPLKEAVGVV